MSTPHITTLPASIREDAAREAEKVVQFDEGDFLRITDAVSEAVAAFYIEQGARLAIEQFGLNFRNEDSELFVAEAVDAELSSSPAAWRESTWRKITEDDMTAYAESAMCEVKADMARALPVLS